MQIRERETEVRLVHVDLCELQAKSDQAFAPRARLDGIVPVGYLLLEWYRMG